jgi:uncharacterized protein (DUF3820 family)
MKNIINGDMEHMAHGTRRELIEVPESIHFGKYKGWPISEACGDEKYFRWLLKHDMIRLGIALAQLPQVRKILEE